MFKLDGPNPVVVFLRLLSEDFELVRERLCFEFERLVFLL